MAVNWSWKNKMGVISWYDEIANKTFKVNIYQANCLGAYIYEFKQDGKNMYQFMGFWNDTKHLKCCLGLSKSYDGTKENIYKDIVKKIKLNTYYKDCLVIAELFAKAGHKVELYYKEVKI